MDRTDNTTREQILRVAMKEFADRGYAGTAVQHIVDTAKMTKPTLYYYFGSKAGLYQALVDYAHDERFRLMQAAAEQGRMVADKLVEILTALFAFLRANRDLMRIAFATAFAAPGEIPAEIRYAEKCSRNFEFIHALIQKGQAAGELDRRFDSRELAFGLYGQFNIYVMAHLMMPDCKLNRQTARRIVELFLAGAAPKSAGRAGKRNATMRRLLFLMTIGVSSGLALSGCSKKAGASGPVGPPPVQVVAVEVKQQPVSETLSLPGTLAANEIVEIKAETDGIVQEISFAEGERVTKGQALVKLDETKFAAALAETEANLKLSQANHDRAKQLFNDKLISQQEFDQTASTFAVNQAGVDLMRRQLKDARLYAPFAGIVGARQISPGQVISRNTTLTWLVDLDTVKVEVKVPERYLRQLKIGQPLEFTVAAFPGEKFRGDVYFISPQIDESTRTALVKARIPNSEGKLRGGMFASLDLTLQLRDAAIVIPEPALMSNGDNFSVFVVDDKGNAQVRMIEVGVRLAGRAEVLKGLNAGETVVVEGTQKLRPGAPVKLAPPEAAAPYEVTGEQVRKSADGNGGR